LRVAERLQIAEELEFAGGMGFFQTLEEEPAEKAAEHLDREKEAAAAANPLAVIWGQAAAGNDAMQVRMKGLTPGMEHGEKAGFHAQTFWVAGNGEQGFGGGAEEEAVGDLLVVKGDGGDGLGEGEDHVEIRGGQQLGAALL
jgi:hypothetical protein